MSSPNPRSEAPQLEFVAEPIAGNSLVSDYLAGKGIAPSFFPGSPYSLDSFREKLRDVHSRFDHEKRARAARALTPTSDRARARLDEFVERGGAMVTTGQQAGFLTGPLYTIHKALTTVNLAERLTRELAVPVVPVFWVASEDHDWEEVNHALVTGSAGGVVRLSLSGPAPERRPMGEHRLEEGVREVIDELAQVIGPTPYADDVLRAVRDSYQPGRSVAAAFRDLLARLLETFDLCLTDAADAVVKEASLPVLEQALTEAATQESRLRERTERIEAAGYRPQVPMPEGATNVFFHDEEAGRVRLYRSEGGFTTPETGKTYDEGSLLRTLRAAPGRFSPNVLLRPVAESTVFPTLAYVGGPGEISYFAQVTSVFDAFGLRPPVVVPRGSVTVVEPPMQRLLAKLELTLDDLRRPIHELVDDLARKAMPEEVGAILAEITESVTSGYRRLIGVAGAIDPTLEEALASMRNQVLARVADSEKKVVRQLKRKEEITVGQLERLRANLRPDGEPQDRVLNVIPLLARQGSGMLKELAPHLEPRIQ